MDENQYISTGEIARVLGISRQAVQKRLDSEMKRQSGLADDERIQLKKVGRGYLYKIGTLPEDLQEELKNAQKEAATSAQELGITSKKPQKDLNFEKELWSAADRLRGNIDASEYKHIVLGLLFLKYISDAFYRRREELQQRTANPKDTKYYIKDEKARASVIDEPDEYLSEGVFYVPEKARWEYLRERATNDKIARHIEEAMDAIEKENEKQLRGVLPKDRYVRAQLDPQVLGELVNIFSQIQFDHDFEREKDMLGRVYEYFLGQFADAEGKRGGEFFTPLPLVRLLVEVLEPFEGARIFDPAVGSGGMFVQSAKFLKMHEKDPSHVAFFGQESNRTTYKLCKMNLAIRGIFGNIEIGNSYYDDKYPDLKADFVLANPPFNAEWNPKRLPDNDPRTKYGTPPSSNANFMWIQHFIHHLAPSGQAGFVMANGALAVGGREGEIRRKIIKDDLIDVIVACPAKLFYNVSLPVSLWFAAKDKTGDRFRKRAGETLFIDARETYEQISRRQVTFTDEQIQKIAGTVRAWRGEKGAGKYEDIPGFCKSAMLEEIEKKAGFVLTPGRYVGIPEEEDDGVPFEEKMDKLTGELKQYFAEGGKLEKEISGNLKRIKS